MNNIETCRKLHNERLLAYRLHGATQSLLGFIQEREGVFWLVTTGDRCENRTELGEDYNNPTGCLDPIPDATYEDPDEKEEDMIFEAFASKLDRIIELLETMVENTTPSTWVGGPK